MAQWTTKVSPILSHILLALTFKGEKPYGVPVVLLCCRWNAHYGFPYARLPIYLIGRSSCVRGDGGCRVISHWIVGVRFIIRLYLVFCSFVFVYFYLKFIYTFLVYEDDGGRNNRNDDDGDNNSNSYIRFNK